MGRIEIEFSEDELRILAEMSALVLSIMGQAMPDMKAPGAEAWQRLCVGILRAAHGVPSIGRDMEMNPDCGYRFFKRPYIDTAFYSDVLEEYRDSAFWSELVERMTEQTLVENVGEEHFMHMSEEERKSRTSAMEKALWNEVSKHGLSRMMFMLPQAES